MFKKTNKILCIIIILTMLMSLMIQPLYAAMPPDSGIELQWQNTSTVTIAMGFSNPKISISVKAVGYSGTTFKNGTVLLEKLNGSKYEYVKDWKGISSSSSLLQFNDSSVTREKGTYKLTITVTAVRNGSEEKITTNKVSTYKG